jgi:hypothetical protein
MNYGTLITEVAIRGGLDTTAGFYTDSILERTANLAYNWAAAYKKWPFTEYMDKSGAFVSGTEENSYPNSGFRTDSIRILKVGNYLFEKILFKDYLQFREDNSSSTEKVFSDFGRTIYINPNCASGTIYAYAQLIPTEMTTAATTTIFTNYDEEANEAIVERSLSLLLKRGKKLQDSIEADQRARQILDGLWKNITDEQHAYMPKNSGMWERIDIVDGEYYDDKNNPLQF